MKKNGIHTEFHENGKKKSDGTYKDGKSDGLYTEWYENGKKKSEGNYKGVDRWNQPQKIGKWTGWHENGQKESEVTYKNGKEIDKKCWDEDGNETECD